LQASFKIPLQQVPKSLSATAITYRRQQIMEKLGIEQLPTSIVTDSTEAIVEHEMDMPNSSMKESINSPNSLLTKSRYPLVSAQLVPQVG